MSIIGELQKKMRELDEGMGYWYKIGDVLTIMISGMLCNLQSVSDIHAWAKAEPIQKFLLEQFQIRKIPSRAQKAQILVSLGGTTLYTSNVFSNSIPGMVPATLEFTKETNSNYIYVNNPEYITHYDMTDGPVGSDWPRWFGKIFDQAGVRGTNTYYQNHLAWWGDERGRFDVV